MNINTWRNLRKQWSGDVYQVLPCVKAEAVVRHADVLRGMKVVDMGCNAGVITHDIAKFVKEWRGVEPNEVAFKQALITAKIIKTPGRFVHSDIKTFLETTDFPYDAAFASCMLYYLSQADLKCLEDRLLPRCKVVLFPSREDKGTSKGSLARSIRNPLWKWTAIRDFLEKAGMHVDVHDLDSNWVSVIGTRSGA